MSEWPSARPATGRATRSPKAGSTVRTEWTGTWLAVAFGAIVVTALTVLLWPVAGQALDAIQQLTDALSTVSRNALI